MDVLQKQQITTFVKVRGMNQPAVIHKGDRNMSKYAIAQFSKYSSGEIARIDCIKSLGYHLMARVNMKEKNVLDI